VSGEISDDALYKSTLSIYLFIYQHPTFISGPLHIPYLRNY